jgi:putative tryptophan/tyrosine transport system substrate-binding protein
LVLVDPIEVTNRAKIIELAAQNRIAAVFGFPVEAVEGGLLSYGPDMADLFRRSAGYVVKLLRGEKAAEIPIEVPERYHLVINLKTANALGLSIPAALLATADDVIE